MIFDSTYAFFLAEDVKRNLIISSVDKGVNIVENTPPTKLRSFVKKMDCIQTPKCYAFLWIQRADIGTAVGEG